MSQNNNLSVITTDGNDTCYQISDDDLEYTDDLENDYLLEETEGPAAPGNTNGNGNGTRGPYERAWTTDATRALIHIRGPMEGRFNEGRQKRTSLWLQCTRQLQKMGYRYSAAKVQKKWHNILITYNKNLSKKYLTGYVHWEFFEDMFKYLQGKKADFDIQTQMPYPTPIQSTDSDQNDSALDVKKTYLHAARVSILQPQVQLETKSNDEFDEDSNTLSELKQPKMEFNEDPPIANLPLEITHANGFDHDISTTGGRPDYPHMISPPIMQSRSDTAWWKDYFERKLQQEREKVQLQKDMHNELMQFNKMSLVQQEKMERVKIEAINNLTSVLQKLVEAKQKKV